MPELPDVEIFRQYLNATSLHQTIKSVKVKSHKILKGLTSQELKKHLCGHLLERSQRYGKYLFVKLNNNYWLVFHFGMTGYLKYFKERENLPHERLLITFANGFHLAYICQRLLGKIYLTQSVDNFIKEKKLGPDALKSTLPTFKTILKGRSGIIKSTLMNQNIIAGIGNIYADEILFQSSIHPRFKSNQLDEKKIKEIFLKMKRILRTAIERRANPDKFPDSYLLIHRHKGGICPRCHGNIEQLKISGRSSYYCSHCQQETRNA